MLDHASRKFGIALDVRGNGVQRIEQKMRIELHAKRVQPRLAVTVFQTLQPQFAVHVALVILVGLYAAENDPVDEPAP